MRGLWERFTALSVPVKIVAAVLLLGVAVLLSPLAALLAGLAFVVCVIVLLLCVLTRRTASRTWGIAAASSFAAVLAFSGVSEALYGGSQPETTPAPKVAEKEPAEPRKQPKPEVEAEKAPEPAQEEVAPKPEPEPEPGPASAQTSIAESTPPPPAPGPAPQPAERAFDASATVTRVVDGDTVEISPAIDGITDVRLIGVDTPETQEPGCALQPYGAEATSYAESVLSGQEVELEFDAEKTDQYGRLLAYVYPGGGEMFNEDLLEGGYAQVATFPPNTRYINRLEAAQAQAQAVPLGIWTLSPDGLALLTDRGNGVGANGCAPLAPEPEAQYAPAPSSSAGQQPAGQPTGGSVAPATESDCPSSHPVKGNQSGIYHLPGGGYYDVTNPEECFAAGTDAEAAGYRASKR